MTTAITTPVGRLVMGSLYKPNDRDANGSPLVVKTGPNIGQPRVEYLVAVAIPKGAETHWKQTPWGQVIYQAAVAAWPGGQYQTPTFAWKIVDGDSQIPNKKGRKPCDQAGHKGCWVLKFSGGFAPEIYNANGTQQLMEPGHVKLGYFIQVSGTVDGNGNQGNPGIYLNHRFVAFSAFGDEITTGPDAASVGFGQSPLPQGAMSAPAAGNFNPVMSGVTTAPAYAPAPAVSPMPAPTPAPAVAAAPPPPNPAILLPPSKIMTPKANGLPYEQWLASGWTEEMLIQHGYMVG